MPMKKTCWSEVQHLVKKINPEFYELINAVNPSDDLSLSFAAYPYGQLIGNEDHFYLPDSNGVINDIPDKDQPLSMVLEGSAELFFETATNVVPWRIFYPGALFPVLRDAEDSVALRFSPGSIFNITSGSRSAFLLNLYSSNDAYDKLRLHYNIPNTINPTDPLDHYKIFKIIAEKECSSWRTKLLIFDDAWRQHIWHNKDWYLVKIYFYQQALKQTNCSSWNNTLNYAMRDIAKRNSFKHKDFSEDIIKQIFFAAIGESPAFVPATDQSALPLPLLAETLNKQYSLSNLPIIMHSVKSTRSGEVKFLSVAQNTITTYDIKTFRPLMYLSEIKEHMTKYLEAFKEHLLTKNTVYAQMSERLSIEYYSEKGTPNQRVLKASDLQFDQRIIDTYKDYKHKETQTFPERAPFLKAFIGFNFK